MTLTRPQKNGSRLTVPRISDPDTLTAPEALQ